MKQLFVKYPQLNNLRSLVPDELIYSEIGSRADEFESYLADAKQRIPTVNLNKVFPDELERGDIRLENFLGHWGNVSIEELCKICLIVKWLKPLRILEMGTYNGMTTLQMALNSPPENNVYTVDLPPDVAGTIHLGKIDEMISKQFCNRFNTKIGSYFEGRRDVHITQLWGETSKIDYDILGGSADLIFVDAAHDYANKRLDTEIAFNLVSPGGVILWHNYADICAPDVTRCLSEYAKTKKIFHLRNTSLAVFFGEYSA